VLGWIVVALIAAYLLFQLWLWLKERALPLVTLADPAEAAHELLSGAESTTCAATATSTSTRTRIRGSRRLDPHALHQSARVELPATGRCICTAPAPGRRPARALRASCRQDAGHGRRIAVIKGGLRAWTRAGLPVEAVPDAEMADMPLFK
jgi:rhodanese-related sulfurtransferase